MADEIKIDDLQPIESGVNIDVSQYEGQKVPIDFIKMDKFTSKFGVDGKPLPPGVTVEQDVIRFYTVPLTTITKADGTKLDIRADESFNIIKTKDGKFGWSTSDKSNIQKFFKKLGINKPTEAIGKNVIVKTRPTKDGTRLFLGIMYK